MKGTIYKSTSKAGTTTWRYQIESGCNDEQGKRFRPSKSGFRLEREAQEAMDAKLAELKGGVVTTAGTLKEFLEAWLPYHAKAKDLAPKTIERNPSLASHVIRALGHVQLRDLTPFLLDDLYAKLHEPDQPKDPKAKRIRPLSAKTIKNIHSVIHTAMRRAVKTKLIPFNPADGCDLPRVQTREMQVLSYEQLESYQRAVSGSWVDLIIRLDSGTALRRGEILAARWSDLDWDRKTLTVSRSLYQVKKKIGIKTTKNRATRVITIPDSLIECLKFHQEAQKQNAAKFGEDYRYDLDLTFANPVGGFLLPSSVTRAAGRFRSKAGIQKTFQPLHGLRHGHASALLGAGVPLTEVSNRLGHKNPLTTAGIYSHALPNTDAKVAAKWDELVAANSARAKLVAQLGTTLGPQSDSKQLTLKQ